MCLKVFTEVAMIVYEDLAIWQKLSLTVLISGITAQGQEIVRAQYIDKECNTYFPLSRQPVPVLTAAANV